MKSHFVIFLFVLACTLPVAAQSTDVLIIEGTVVDKSNNTPLSFATVSLLNNRLGTISNSKGAFRFVIPATHKNDSLRISFIGYKSAVYKVSEIPVSFKSYLEEDTQLLQEVVVTGLTGRELMEKALQKIPENYYEAPYVSKGFYRLVSKKENSCVALSEAVFDVYHAKQAKKSQLRLEKMRAIKDEKLLKAVIVGMKANAAYEFDIANTLEEWDFLNKNAFNDHTFVLDGMASYNDRQVYVIAFDQKEGLKKAGYKGRLFIDTKTYAFVHFDFGLSPKGIAYYRSASMAEKALMTLMGIWLKTMKAQYQISYTNIDGKYYLSKAGIDHTFALKSKSQHYNFNLDSRVDYLITAIETTNSTPFEQAEVLASGELIEQQNAIYDQGFWDSYNIILPGADFLTMAKNIEAGNRANDFKTEIANQLRKYPKDKGARIDSVLSFYNRKDLFNGNALIEYKGELIFQKSYNNALTQNQLQTRFRIGSTSKTFTSMLILLLEEEGKLKVTDSIGKYLPDYVHPQLTIEQLLTHQSGIPNYLENNEYLEKIFSRLYLLDEVIADFCSDSLEFAPGSRFNYSNSGFVLLSKIIEQVEGKSLGRS